MKPLGDLRFVQLAEESTSTPREPVAMQLNSFLCVELVGTNGARAARNVIALSTISSRYGGSLHFNHFDALTITTLEENCACIRERRTRIRFDLREMHVRSLQS